ncbi:probable G-protein coupled receptor Mth-like 6 [Drosophila teissieri]|uniref:probable G-protein coupled receptor Mth-like 6 n=1 Tax=Drosophila teissieri TaxID=7243 RepID=UPI001CB9EC3A|nr:probable G-protein coupled receptor Mth-like 6 [Drosophila teissieri]
MRLNIFAIIVFAMLGQSEAVIPECDYFDTVDISHIPKLNNSYAYEGLTIPAHLTGLYAFRQLADGSQEPVKTHLRACICKLKLCIRFCCPRNKMLPNSRCSDGLTENLKRFNPHLKITLQDGSQKTYHLLTDMIVLRNEFRYCEKVVTVQQDQYQLYENGSFMISQAANWTLGKQWYCLYPRFEDLNFIWILEHVYIPRSMPAVPQVGTISMVGCILTITVYLYIKKLRNLLGKCFICYVFCKFVQYLIWAGGDLNWLINICSLAGYTNYFFALASHFWLSVMSHHIWKNLRLINRDDPRYHFLAYNVYGWGTPAIMTAITYLVDWAWEDRPDKLNWIPGVGLYRCWINTYDWSAMIYLYGPMLILSLFNVFTFILTVIHIRKVKSSVKNSTQQQQKCMKNYDFLLYLRLSVMMGGTGIFEVITYLVKRHNVWQQVLRVPNFFHLGSGVIVFVLFILKRSTIQMILERISGPRRQQSAARSSDK